MTINRFKIETDPLNSHRYRIHTFDHTFEFEHFGSELAVRIDGCEAGTIDDGHDLFLTMTAYAQQH